MAIRDFRFYLGSLALNFSATLAFRRIGRVERLPSAKDLARWFVAAKLSETLSSVTEGEYRRAILLREAIFATGDALVGGRKPRRDDVDRINRAARLQGPTPYLDPGTLAVRQETRNAVDAALSQVARDAISVFAGERSRLSRCEDERCGALVLSRSRGADRRWCSMSSCGNRAKVAAYRARHG